MKRVLSFLLMVVFMHVQVPTVFAKHGGPDFGGSQQTIVGTYAGVMLPIIPLTPNQNGTGVSATNSSLTANSLGIFSISAPQTGTAVGSVAFFTNGEVFTGSLNGVADPADGSLKCLFDAATTLRFGGATSTTTITGQALGKLEAKAKAAKAFGAQRIQGTAHADLYLGQFEADGSVAIAESFDFTVDGFQQSSEALGVSDFVFTTAVGGP
jgi:hypothetical protein